MYDRIAYDIDGVSNSEYEMCIPVSLLGRAIDNFRHIPNQENNITEQEIAKIGIECKEKYLYIDVLFYQDLVRIKQNDIDSYMEII